jgi:CelD/BcsL family acetyltransferase involved in cellulose biosynthesis
MIDSAPVAGPSDPARDPGGSHRPLSVEQVSDIAALADLRSEWTELLARTATNEIALTWEWLYTWWAVFGHSSRRLLVLTLREGASGRLVGLAPFQRRSIALSPLLPAVRRLEFLASGEEDADAICSDYLNVLAERGREQEVADSLAAYLCTSLAHEWDDLHFTAMDAAATTTMALSMALRNVGLVPASLPLAQCPYLRLPASWDTLLAGLDSRTSAELRRSERRLSESGRLELRRAQSPAALDSQFTTLIELHQRRHAAKGVTGAFESSSFTAFHRRLMPLALDNGWLDLRTLFLDGRPVAARYCFRHAGRVLYYQGGMDTAAAPRASIGLVMDAYCIGEAVRDGLREYDFMRGTERYKRRWAPETRELITLRVESGRPRSVALARRVGRRLRGRWAWIPSRRALGIE